MNAEPLLSVKDLRKYYATTDGLFSSSKRIIRAVDGVSFDVGKGETLGLVGESGCGKTTTGRCILRLIEPTSGEIWMNRTNILSLRKEEMRSVRRNMQMIFQDPFASLNPRMSVGTIVEEPLLIHHIGNKNDRALRVAELLNMVGIDPHLAKRYPHEFSGGQRQRIGIARALALNPMLIVADEPVSALDVSVQAQIINLLTELQQKLGLTFLFIAHDLSVVQHFSDRIGVMYLGKLVEISPSAELFRSPFHPYTRVLLESIPVPDPDARKNSVPVRELDTHPPTSGCRFRDRCRFAMERCKEEVPVLREVSKGHWAACHLESST